GEDTGATAGVTTIKVTDPYGVYTLTKYDIAGRRTSVQVGSTSPAGTLAAGTFTYDVSGNVTNATDPTGVYLSNTYDAYGEMTKATAPTGVSGAGKDTIYTYDAAGRVPSVQDADSNTT